MADSASQPIADSAPAPLPEIPLAERALSSLTDAEIASLTADLKNEQTLSKPLVSSLDPISTLKDEYEGAPSFLEKIGGLEEDGWTGVRRMRGDGDCFYRALIFGYLEKLVASPAASAAKSLAKFDGLLPMLEQCGYQKDIIDDFYSPLRTFLSTLSSGPVTPAVFADLFSDSDAGSEFGQYTIVFLRLVTAAFLKTHSDDFTPFLFMLEDDPRFFEGGVPSLEQFCGFYVEPVGKEADHIAITALTRALSLHIRIAYLDQSHGSKVELHEFEPEGEESLDGALLYRPGHYDVLYKSS